jgi:uncharacterized coiled-coil DUF342 family protein
MAESDDLRAFIREIMARFDRKMDAFEAELKRQRAEFRSDLRDQRAEFRAEFRAHRAELIEQRKQFGMELRAHLAHIEEIRRNTDEVIAEGRAGRAALFHILDELRGSGGGPAAAGS